jgi:hypothetical protein
MSVFTVARYMFRPRRPSSGEGFIKYQRKAVFELPCNNGVILLTPGGDNGAVFTSGKCGVRDEMDNGSVRVWSCTWGCVGLKHCICLEVKNTKDLSLDREMNEVLQKYVQVRMPPCYLLETTPVVTQRI